MARIGSFDSELRDVEWFGVPTVAEGWFDENLVDAPAAGGGTTITCSVAEASAIGVTAAVPRTVQAGPGAASAAGVTALVPRTLQAGPGAASATGVTALVPVTLQAGPGAASAAGVTALLPRSVVSSVGEASATGVTAALVGDPDAIRISWMEVEARPVIQISQVEVEPRPVIQISWLEIEANATVISCGVGGASADGVAANVTITLPADAIRISWLEIEPVYTNTTITCTVGDAGAQGVPVVLPVAIAASVGEASAQGVPAHLHLQITTQTGEAAAAGVPADVGLRIAALTGNADATGTVAQLQRIFGVSVGNAIAEGVQAIVKVPSIISYDQAQLLYQIYLLHGLDAAHPLTVTPSARSAGGLAQTVSGTDPAVINTSTTPRGIGLDAGALIDELASLHGLTNDLTVTATSRTAGAISQALAVVGDTTTVTRA